MNQKTLARHDQLMQDYFDTHEYIGGKPWHEMAVTADDPEEEGGDGLPLAKDSPGPSDVHVPNTGGKTKDKIGDEDDEENVPVDRGKFTIEKIDVEKRLVGGWASVIERPDGTPIVDSQGDVIFEDDLVEAAHAFMAKSRELGYNHKIKKGLGTIVESVVFTKGLKEKMGLPASFPTGWYILAKVHDDDVWALVKSGELKAFSIGGSGVREPVE